MQAVVIKAILDCGRLGGDSRLVFDRRSFHKCTYQMVTDRSEPEHKAEICRCVNEKCHEALCGKQVEAHTLTEIRDALMLLDVGMISVGVWNSKDKHVVSKLEARCGMSTEMSTESSRESRMNGRSRTPRQTLSKTFPRVVALPPGADRCRPVRIKCGWRLDS